MRKIVLRSFRAIDPEAVRWLSIIGLVGWVSQMSDDNFVVSLNISVNWLLRYQLAVGLCCLPVLAFRLGVRWQILTHFLMAAHWIFWAVLVSRIEAYIDMARASAAVMALLTSIALVHMIVFRSAAP